MNKKKFDLGDFIGDEIGKNIDPNDEISRFAEIKVEAIDPRMRSEIEEKLKNIKQNLNKLKKI